MSHEIIAGPGRVDILVVSANGRREPLPIAQMTEQHWGFVIDVARLAARHHSDGAGAKHTIRVIATFDPVLAASDSTEGATQ